MTGGSEARGRWVAVPLGEVVRRLLETGLPEGRPFVVAVDGRSGSGKSTLADRLADRLAAASTHSPVLPANGAVWTVRTDDVAWWQPMFGWDRLLARHVLEPLRAGRSVSWTPDAWPEHGRSGAVEVPAGCAVVLVEGVGSACRRHAGLLDAVVWVDADPAVARTRGIAREGGTGEAARFWDEWTAAEETYLEQDRPWSRATVRVCGTPETAGSRPEADQVLLHRPPGTGSGAGR